MPTILIAEDESAIAQTVLYALRAEGWNAEHVLLGGEVLPRVRRGGIDLLILDVGLPDANGFDVCRALRAESALPVIFLTARDGEVDRVLGLELGGDDYVPKPFSPRELVARVRARLRRAAPASGEGGWRAHGRFGIDEAGHNQPPGRVDKPRGGIFRAQVHRMPHRGDRSILDSHAAVFEPGIGRIARHQHSVSYQQHFIAPFILVERIADK